MNLDRAQFAIAVAWVLTLVVGVGNIILTFIYGSAGTIADVTLFNWLDLIITFAFAFAIYKKSRIAAGSWIIYYFVTTLIIWLESEVGGPPVLPIVFLIFFIHGFRGTIAYHRLKDASGDPVTT